MAFNLNPVDGEIFISPSGVRRQWNATQKVWEKIEQSIVPDTSGTNDSPISKVWTGTYAEYQALVTKSDEVVYFIKD